MAHPAEIRAQRRRLCRHRTDGGRKKMPPDPCRSLGGVASVQPPSRGCAHARHPLRLSGTPRYVLFLGRSPTHGIQRRHGRGRALRPPPRRFRRPGMGPGTTGTRSPPPHWKPPGNASTSPERGRTRSTRSTSPKSGACPASKNAPSCTAGHSSLPLIWSPPCSASCRKNRRRPVLSFNRREM